MSELLPCPFCGGEAEMGVNRESAVREYFVGCMNCHIRLYKIGYKRFYTEAEAIAAWNNRAERTCKLKQASWDDGSCTWGCVCSACDAHFEHETGIGYNYCPNCGRKVST